MYYNRARSYDPQTGRFIQQDPIGFAAGDANLYRYVGNGPTTRRDPTGLDWITDPIADWIGDKCLKLGMCDGGPSKGYIDINGQLGFVLGITTGVMIDSNLNIYPYVGWGVMTPPGGLSIMIGTGGVTPGHTDEISGGAGIGAAGGESELLPGAAGPNPNPNLFWQIGLTTPGALLNEVLGLRAVLGHVPDENMVEPYTFFVIVWLLLTLTAIVFFTVSTHAKLKKIGFPWFVTCAAILFIVMSLSVGFPSVLLIIALPFIVIVCLVSIWGTKFCPHCGRTLFHAYRAKYCHRCGATLNP